VKVGVAADHAGQALKAALLKHLAKSGHDVKEYGPSPDPDDDYPLIVRELAHAVARGEVERGIFTCGSGIGPAVAANKIPGIRAAVVDNEWSARDAVKHVDVNLLTMGERVIGDELAKSILDAYLGAKVEGGRHERRRKQIESMEATKV
jgi:ribose 5-phosphate isomerase B